MQKSTLKRSSLAATATAALVATSFLIATPAHAGDPEVAVFTNALNPVWVVPAVSI